MNNWHAEIQELHDVFQAYFIGTIDSLERVEAVLAADFSIVGPDGIESSRTDTMQALRAGHAHTQSLLITITEPRLLFDHGETVVARYVENHLLAERSNHRLSTVVFAKDNVSPNGLLWRSVQETWMT